MKTMRRVLACVLISAGFTTLMAYQVILPVKNCNDHYELIWHHFNYGSMKSTKRLLEHCTFSGDVIVDAMNVLKGGIAYREGEYEAALRAVAPSAERIIHHYAVRKSSPREGESENDIAFLYFYLLSMQANANFALGNYNLALENYEQWLESSQTPDINLLRFAAHSAYFLEQFERGIGHLKRAFELLTDQASKDEISYVIASFYARLGDAENAVAWLRSPLGNARERYRAILRRDSDFDGIRSSAEFKRFLRVTALRK